MSKFPPRRFLVNFVDGTAEFNNDATPPAQEYVSLIEFDALQSRLTALEAACEEVSSLLRARAHLHEYAKSWDVADRLEAALREES